MSSCRCISTTPLKDYAEYSRSVAKAGTLLSALGQKRKNSIRALDVRFTPESGQSADMLACPLCATSRHMQCSKGALFDHLVGLADDRHRTSPG
jgi:hypothetical protein